MRNVYDNDEKARLATLMSLCLKKYKQNIAIIFFAYFVFVIMEREFKNNI